MVVQEEILLRREVHILLVVFVLLVRNKDKKKYKLKIL
jgi:hypothetical protein